MGMNKISNWEEVTRGYYRYIIATKVCYELIIIYWDLKTDVTTSKVNLYITGCWNGEGKSFFERELLHEGTLEECISSAVKDREEWK